MTLYAIFDPKPGTADLPAAIPAAFSWFAAVLPPIFMVVHGLWLETVAWFLATAALVVLSAVIGGTAAFWLYVVGAVWVGCAAADLRRHALQWRGWQHRGERVAASADLAQLEALQ